MSFIAGLLASGIKYPWLTRKGYAFFPFLTIQLHESDLSSTADLYSNRLKTMSFAPDAYSSGNYVMGYNTNNNNANENDPNAMVNAVFHDGEGRPTFNYQSAMRKYWNLLNKPYDNHIKKWFNLPGRLVADEPTPAGDYQYAQLGTPEYQPDEPFFPPDLLRKPKKEDNMD
ncbi:hypothetical protein BV898_06088 [Hypsibius exemplaris]|uniref:Uncharacterized protein n=1 Tax=Hypsibius exemplaris TaxID=2072580 RepID=A0A1W0WX99_HYPEX|nr:hypothetical protein BV898_06088 [Hypsibius exemplaris]